MRIIHILLGKANPNTMNGVNVVVHNLATAQLEQNIDVEVWGITKTPEKINHKYSYDLTLFPKKRFGFFIDENLKGKIKNVSNQTIFHLHSAFIPELFTIAKLLKKLDIPYLVTPHGAFNKSAMNNNKIQKSLYFKIFERKILINAKLLHFIGLSEMEHVRNLGIITKSVLIPNGTEKINLNVLDCKKHEDTIVFSYCGRISIYTKGLDLLLDAFINYKNHGGKGILKFIGDGCDLNTLIERAKFSDLTEDIHFLGKRFGSEKLNILCSSDVFIHTSRHDVMPTAALEASSLSLPLLISRETNLGNYIEKYKAGIVLEENSIAKIEKSLFQMENLYFMGKLEEYGINAKTMIDKELNWDKIAQVFINHYENILGTA